MATAPKTMAAFMASFFGKSEKVISEKLTTDEHNQFTSEVQELNSKVSNLENEKTTLEGEKTTLQEQVTNLTTERDTLASEKTTLEGDKTTLQNSLTSAETERNQYKAWFEKQKGVGAQLPTVDETSKGGAEMSDYNAGALAAFRKHNS